MAVSIHLRTLSREKPPFSERYSTETFFLLQMASRVSLFIVAYIMEIATTPSKPCLYLITDNLLFSHFNSSFALWKGEARLHLPYIKHCVSI